MTDGARTRVYAKCEFMNPGSSVKDRIGLGIVEDAERRRQIRPGGTIVEATSDLVCAYKPNLGFYESLGPSGNEALEQTLKTIPSWIPVIGDSKRGDIGNTATAYARAMFALRTRTTPASACRHLCPLEFAFIA